MAPGQPLLDVAERFTDAEGRCRISPTVGGKVEQAFEIRLELRPVLIVLGDVRRALESIRLGRREFLDWCGRWPRGIHHWEEADVAGDLAYTAGWIRPGRIERRQDGCG